MKVTTMSNKLIDILIKCNNAYSNGEIYVLSDDDKKTLKEYDFSCEEEVSDQVYDSLYQKAKTLFYDDLFFNKVTSINTGYGQDIKLEYPAGSLTECKPGEIEKWVSKFNTTDEFIFTEKLDGLSLIMIYNNGEFKQAISRGDGYTGKDVTRHIQNLTSIPQKIGNKEYLVIRGECICKKDNINNMLKTFNEETGKEYKNGRNTIAGYLNNKNTIQAGKDLIDIVCYDIMNKNDKLSDKLQALRDNRFLVVKSTNIQYKDINTSNLQEEFLNIKENSLYECDGLVVTHNISEERSFETGTINPTNSRKFKTLSKTEVAETIIEDITWQISKWGKFTPVLNIKPVYLSGVTISNVSGFNYKQVLDNGWGIGAKVLIQRSGDVIPKVNQTVIRNDNDFNLPDCDTIINGVDLYIDLTKEEISNKYLLYIAVEKIISFVQALDIEQLGSGNIIKIVEYYFEETGNILTLLDFLSLNEDIFKKLIGINGVKAKTSIRNRLSNITESRFFGATDVFGQGIGYEVLNKIESKYGKLLVTKEELEDVPGLGEVRVKQILNHYSDYSDQKYNFRLKFPAYKFVKVEPKPDTTDLFKVIFTGFRSSELKKMFEEAGGIVVDNFSKDINLVVTRDLNKNSAKTEAAKKYGIKIISYSEALNTLKVHKQF